MLLGAAPLKPPYPPSPVIARVEFDFDTHQRHAPGSDNWPLTWADDGHLYTAWGDGGGFGGTNSQSRVTLGVARVEGDATNYKGINVWGGAPPGRPAQFGGKSYGILSVGGVLYLWVAPQPNPHLAYCQIAVSRDHGASWRLIDWTFRFEDELTIPTFLNFGRDYAGARDGYVYSYYIKPAWGPAKATKRSDSTFDVHRPGAVFLSRVPKDRILEREAYEFFAGRDGQNAARWSADLGEKRSVFADAGNGVGWNLSVSYNAGLRRYILCTQHTAIAEGNLGIFDAPEPWGPWTTVAFESGWGTEEIGRTSWLWHFPTKWLSATGTEFTMVFTGKFANDSWNTVRGRFVLAKPRP
jgi:hypothetical protein